MKSFADALAAAGLHRLFYKAGGEKAVDLKMATSEAEQQKMGEANTAEASGAAVAPPESSKIVYFECIAGTPSEAAALRVQKSRHAARTAHRASKSSDSSGGNGQGAAKAKSAGASFDVDVGGYLGFGCRVPRSYVASDGELGRSAREQAIARREFLRLVASQDEEAAKELREMEAAAAASASKQKKDDADDVEEVDDVIIGGAAAEAEEEGSIMATYHAAIASQVNDLIRKGHSDKSNDPGKLDYTQWRWRAVDASAEKKRSDADPEEDPLVAAARLVEGYHTNTRWQFRPSGQEAAASSQVRSGWQWTLHGWSQSAPLGKGGKGKKAAAQSSSKAKSKEAAVEQSRMPPRMAALGRMKRRRIVRVRAQERLWGPLRDCWWRRMLLRRRRK